MELVALAFVAGFSGGTAATFLVARALLRHSLRTEREQFANAVETARGQIRDATDTMASHADRATRERHRVEMAERRAADRAAGAGEQWDTRKYRVHLQRGGARLPAVEKALGFHNRLTAVGGDDGGAV